MNHSVNKSLLHPEKEENPHHRFTGLKVLATENLTLQHKIQKGQQTLKIQKLLLSEWLSVVICFLFYFVEYIHMCHILHPTSCLCLFSRPFSVHFKSNQSKSVQQTEISAYF